MIFFPSAKGVPQSYSAEYFSNFIPYKALAFLGHCIASEPKIKTINT